MALSPARLLAVTAGGSALAIAALVGVASWWMGRGVPHDSSPPAPPDRAAEVASAGMNAPGTAELKQAGCDQAIVIDLLRLLGDAGAVREGDARYMVTCDVADGSQVPGPSCEKAAAAFFAGAGGTCDGNVVLRVMRSGSLSPLCSRLYAPSGALLR